MRSLRVVEALSAVIEWHQRALLPFAAELTSDPRCHLVHADFFALVADGTPFGRTAPARFHAILVDIDHSPRHVLHPSHAAFYEPDGLRRLADRLHPGGVFALWADGAPDPDFLATVTAVFERADAHIVTFPNFYTSGESSSTVYIAITQKVDARTGQPAETARTGHYE